MAYDHNTDQPAYPARVIQGAPDFTDAAAWHCYQGPVADYTILEVCISSRTQLYVNHHQDFHYNFPKTPQFMTECSNTGLAPGTTNFWMAQQFIPSVRYGASGGSFWVLATDPNYGPHSPYGGCGSCSGAVFVNSSSVYEKTIDYYMMGQFSRFIRRGSVNYHILQGLQGTGTDWTAQFWAIAVQNPDKGWAVVFLNTFPQDQNVDLAFTQSGYTWQGTIPASSVVTWLLPSDQILAINDTRPHGPPFHTMGSRPPYPFYNHSSHGRPNWSRHPFGRTTGAPSVCSASATTTSSSSSSSTLLPVPNTTHTIAAQA